MKQICDGKTITICNNQNPYEEKMRDSDTLVKHPTYIAEEEKETLTYTTKKNICREHLPPGYVYISQKMKEISQTNNRFKSPPTKSK